MSEAEKIDRAFKEVFGLCDGSRRWTMRIPVDDDDSDRVICAGLEVGRDAVAERDALRTENERLRAQVGQLREAGEDVSDVWGAPDELYLRGDMEAAIQALRAVLAATAPAETGEEADRG